MKFEELNIALYFVFFFFWNALRQREKYVLGVVVSERKILNSLMILALYIQQLKLGEVKLLSVRFGD